MILLEALQSAVRGAASSNPYAEEPPVCILWTDADRMFEPILPTIRQKMPELFVLGDYAPDEKRGPAIWLRFLLDGGRIEGEAVPVFYLPGVSRAELRPEDSCPFLLAPLCELLFRGKAWAHENGKDWTLVTLLSSLGIEIQTDAAAREALVRALPRLLTLDIHELKSLAPLSATALNDLLNPEPVEALLYWMNGPTTWKATRTPEEWTAFVETSKTKYGFNPGKDGELRAGELLGGRQNAWQSVWRTFERSPQRFEGVVDLLDRMRVKSDDLFFEKSSWPRLNAEEETKLRQSLLALQNVPASEARNHVAELEALHGQRRDWVWSQLGHSPLAQALRHLDALARETAVPLVGATPQEIAEHWTQGRWKCDAALLDALANVEDADWDAVKVAARSLYRDWLDQSAQHFAKSVGVSPFEAESGFGEVKSGVCYLFADGLRFDVAQKLAGELVSMGLQADCKWQFGPLPGITPTAKPAATPMQRETFEAAGDLETCFVGGRKVTAESLRGELKKNGFQILLGAETGKSKGGSAWTECGAFDSIGHNGGALLARRLGEEIKNLASRIRSLLNAGWDEVRITTDHGWMLLPGNLEKAHLPEHLAQKRKGRCARLKEGSLTEFQTVPWYWDASVAIAMAPGARCFEEGKEYEHGGLSVQECVLPLLTIRSHSAKPSSLRLGSCVWRGFRCVVTWEGEELPHAGGERVDLRTRATDADSSLCAGGKVVGGESVTLFVPDDERGTAAHVVLLNASGTVLDKVTTTVPEE